MNDLNTMLEHAAGPATAPPVDVHADLTRGQRALARTRRRRATAGLLGVAAAGVVGIGISKYADPGETTARATEDHRTDSTGVTLLAQPFEAGPYTFDSTPQGWEVQGAYPTAVTIAPIGFPDQEPLSFVGKLVILFDGNPPGGGEQVQLDGRTFWVHESADYTTISTRTRSGEPDGVVRIQYPSDTGWTRDTMLQFLAGVEVGPGAQQGVG